MHTADRLMCDFAMVRSLSRFCGVSTKVKTNTIFCGEAVTLAGTERSMTGCAADQCC